MLLFTPGPTPVLESVRVAMATPTIHHRTPEFESIFERVREGLFELMECDEIVMLASTGTGAMESAVVNLCHDTLLSINSGKFGERFGKIASAHSLGSVELKYEWDTPASCDDVLQALRDNPSIDAVAIQISESAGGLRHDVEMISKAIKDRYPHVMVIADGITAVGVEKIDTANIDALLAGSQKALMLPPGLAIVGLSSEAIEKIGNGRGYYFNLSSEIKKQRQNTTAYTAATTLVIGLDAVLKQIKERGFDALYKETKMRAIATREALKSIGLHIYPKSPALSMTTVDDVDASSIRALLKESYGVNVAGGQDHLKGKIFRINHMGFIAQCDSVWVVNSIELALDKLGRRKFDGSASKIYSSCLKEPS